MRVCANFAELSRRAVEAVVIAINDAVQTRYYVDPRSVSIIESYSARGWVHRWFHHGLHSFDVPWLYNRRPLWDIVMVTLLLTGTALCATSVLLAYRVLARKLLSVVARVPPQPAHQAPAASPEAGDTRRMG